MFRPPRVPPPCTDIDRPNIWIGRSPLRALHVSVASFLPRANPSLSASAVPQVHEARCSRRAFRSVHDQKRAKQLESLEGVGDWTPHAVRNTHQKRIRWLYLTHHDATRGCTDNTACSMVCAGRADQLFVAENSKYRRPP